MVRLSDITDPELRQRVTELLAERQGISPASIPTWYEMDDGDYSELLIELHRPPAGDELDAPRDWRE
jgi:hypothetical protein